MPHQLLDWITFPYDDATRRKLSVLYKQKESLLDSEFLQEHLFCQPLLGVLLFVFVVLSLGSFIFAIIFIACRTLGNCGAKRYQSHPPNGHRYVLYLALIVISWIGLAGSTIHFVGAGVVLWNSPAEIDGLETRDAVLQHQKHVIRRRDNTRKTVRQLFEDSDYAGDFEELDPTTVPPFIIEAKTVDKPTTSSEPKEIKKQGDSKNAKWFRNNGQGTPITASAYATSSPISQFFLLESKLNIERKSLTTVKPVSMHISHLPRRKQNLTYTREDKTMKTISQPFVSDTWSNAGKQAFYRHELSPLINGAPDSPPTTLLVDNSVTRTDAPAVIVPELRQIAELEIIQQNTIANEAEETQQEASYSSSTTLTTSVHVKLATGPESTTELAITLSTTAGEGAGTHEATKKIVTESRESTETSSATKYEELSSETYNASAEVTEDLKTSTDEFLSSQTAETTTESSAEFDPLTSSLNPVANLTSQLSAVFKEDPFTGAKITATTTNDDTKTPPATIRKVTATTSASTSSTTTTTTTATPSTTSQTMTTSPTRAIAPLMITGLIPVEDSTTEVSHSTDTTTSTTAYTVNRRRTMLQYNFGKNWQNMESEEESISSAIVRTTQVDATAAVQPDESTGENLKIQRKARYKVQSTFPVKELSDETTDRNTSVKMMHEGQLTWPGRIFVFFVAVIMVLLTVPTPMLITAGTVCYMRSYHPMDRTTFSDKVGQICVVLATVLLFVIPCICLYLDALLAYIHIYFAFCPEIQAVAKAYSLNVPVPIDRITSGPSSAQMCQRNPEMNSLRDIWLSCFFFVLFSFPTILALFKLSKYYLRMKSEYYWNAGDGYGVIRPKVATVNDAIYGNVYGTLQAQRKRPASKPPPRPAEPATYGVYIEQPIYGAFK